MGSTQPCPAACIVMLLVAVVSGSVLSGCMSADTPTDATPVQIRLGVSEEILCALVFVADEIDTFGAHGLEVEVVPYSSSALAYAALRTGEVDAATVADIPIVLAGSRGAGLGIIATIGRSANDIKIVANATRGIREPSDLRQAAVATKQHTGAHYFLHSYLASQGIDDGDVHEVFAGFAEATEMLVAGEVDAAAIREPFLESAMRSLAADAVVFESPELYVKKMNVLAGPTLDGDARRRLLAALIDAEGFGDGPECDEVPAHVAEWLYLEPDEWCAVVCEEEFVVRLEQGLVLQLEDQARWASANEIGEWDPIPDFLGMIDTEPLEALDPGRVRVIR